MIEKVLNVALLCFVAVSSVLLLDAIAQALTR
jgi:hypothetical protein